MPAARGSTYNSIAVHHIGPQARFPTELARNQLRRTINRENARATYMATQRASRPRTSFIEPPPPARPRRRTSSWQSLSSHRSPPPAYRSRERLPIYESPPAYDGDTDSGLARLGRGRSRAYSASVSASSYSTYDSELPPLEYADVYGLEAQLDRASRQSSYPRRMPRQSPSQSTNRRSVGRRGGAGTICCIILGILPLTLFVTCMALWFRERAAWQLGSSPEKAGCKLNERISLNETVAFTCLNRDAAPQCFETSLRAPYDPAWKTDKWRPFVSVTGAMFACKAYMNFDEDAVLMPRTNNDGFVSKQWRWKCQEAKCRKHKCRRLEGVCVGDTSGMTGRERFKAWNAPR